MLYHFIIIGFISLLIGLFSGFVVRKSGYSFARYAVTGFLASFGILSLLWKILREYL